SMGGVMLPISMASTCCMACGKAAPQEGLPSNLNSSALVCVGLLIIKNASLSDKILPNRDKYIGKSGHLQAFFAVFRVFSAPGPPLQRGEVAGGIYVGQFGGVGDFKAAHPVR